jgi:hypothetical protein
MEAGRAWVLNLDADVELAAPGPYTPTRAVRDAMRVWSTQLAPALLDPGDVVVDEATPRGAARGRAGRAFCPTPRALSLLERAGAVPEPSPPVSVLRHVNGRAFSAAVGASLPGALLPGAAFVTDEDAARRLLASGPPPGFEAWRVKLAFGMAGRGQRVIRRSAGSPDAISPADWAFVRGGLAPDRGGGVMIEPDVSIVREYALHGVLAPDGAVALGAVVLQRCDARGRWLATERLAERPSFAPDLEATARAVASALHHAGYFGPFGIDAFSYAAPEGAPALHLLGEINARYSMGFAVGLGRIAAIRFDTRPSAP